MWHANDKKSVGRSSPADYEGKRCSAVSYSTGKLGKFAFSGWFYARVIRPLSAASYGTYLMHIMVLVVLSERLKGSLPAPVAIAGIAAGTFAVSSVVSMILRKIPLVGKWICG